MKDFLLSYENLNIDKFSELKQVIKKDTKDKKIVTIKNEVIGGKTFSYIFGPCAVEGFDMLEKTAKFIDKINTKFIRAGAFKLRTSPYSFNGLRQEGIQIIKKICDKYNLISFSEIADTSDIDLFKDNIDVIVVGARNMQNISLLEKLGKVTNPILLKRNPGSTIYEFLASAEFIINSGNPNVILCERGIRSIDPYNRYSIDIGGVIALKQITNLPIIIDPSHAMGRREFILQLSRAAKAIPVDGLLIEMHPDVNNALSDKRQAITFEMAERIKKDCEKIKF